MKIKVGIFFGGPSREREISFAGGRTVYDNLNKSLFEPVPIFVDSFRNFILLDWQYLYKGSIRDFYPPVAVLPPSAGGFQIYVESLGALSAEQQQQVAGHVGRYLLPTELPGLMDVAFLALHGEYGEDGQLQAQLAQLGIPYTGSGIRASQIGMDKAWQKELMGELGFARPAVQVVERAQWAVADVRSLYASAAETIGFPLVIRPANQGSSIGVSIIGREEGIEGFERAVNRAFFREIIPLQEWAARSLFEKQEYVRLLADIRDGLGFPLTVTLPATAVQHTLYHPDQLFDYLEQLAPEGGLALLEAGQGEEKVILEAFIAGKEFSCIVLRTEDGGAVALPPTEIVKGSEVFDYRSKYLPGLSRKVTPIDLPDQQIELIRRECERLFDQLGFQVYARIDGFIQPSGQVFLNDPNTTSGMLPSSFFFHQAAEIGLNPSQFLTFILRISLQERLQEQPDRNDWRRLLSQLDQRIADLQLSLAERRRVGLILGGYSFERHISVESGRNVFEKLSSSDTYEPIPLFLTGDASHYYLYQLPINLLLKDNADDIRDKIRHWRRHPLVERIKQQCQPITAKYASAKVTFDPVRYDIDDLPAICDFVFIALHGRPGEDGHLQQQLDRLNMPYNGSGARSSSITIHKYRTLQSLGRAGMSVTPQLLLARSLFRQDPGAFFEKVENTFAYPLIAKPVDDGCSSAVKVIRDRQQLEAYIHLLFASPEYSEQEARRVLKLRQKEEFPTKDEVLFEELVTARGADRFMEITGGMLTHYQPDGSLRYEVFEPSEALAGGEVLSLEEKFLAGEGQNLTPARLTIGSYPYEHVSRQVKADLEKAARLLDVQGYCRIDAFVRMYANGQAETLVIEVNSLPGMTPATAIFHQAALAGYKPYAFIQQLIQFGFERRQRLAPGAVAAGPPVAGQQEPPGSAAAAQPIFPARGVPAGGTAAAQPVVPGSGAAAAQPIVPGSGTPAPLPVVPTGGTPAAQPIVPTAGAMPPPRQPLYAQPALPSGARRAWDFLRSRYFLTNLGAMLGSLVLFMFILHSLLKVFTLHGQMRRVSTYANMPLEKAIAAVEADGFRVVVDSAEYDPDVPPLQVLQQLPLPGALVKNKRSIYLTVSPVNRKLVRLPLLTGSEDYEMYTRKLRALKIKFAIREEVYNAQFDENTILHFYHGNRRITDQDLKGGVSIPQGDRLDFVVTIRQTGTVEIPFLICKTYDEASFLLSNMQLSLGEVIGDTLSTVPMYVYRQEPAYLPGNMMPLGTVVTLYLSEIKPDDCEPPMAPEAVAGDSLSF